MNVDKIRFNHLPAGSIKEDPIPHELKLIGGMKTYVAVSSNTGLVKIGRSTNYELRIRQQEVRRKDVLLVVSVFNDDREMRLHRRFADKRVTGEWFRLTLDEVAQLRKEGHIQ